MSRHPVGIVLRRCGYSVIPSLEELAKQGLDQNGDCIVTSFTIIRQGYGKNFFEGPLDVAHLNLDDIVSIGCKMVAVYPDVSMKPSEGEGLNRRAEITLYSLWPLDKSTGNYITYPQYHRNRSTLPGFENRLARDLHNIQATFISYSPEKGALRFQVNNFSQYAMDGCLYVNTIGINLSCQLQLGHN
ncbi:nuclear pore complex protein Nup98-Nup96-like [Daphnia magna]|uniref:Peptidase S59 domain-containing protein n=1 Tax=Daphnia magna TaxID=35525 RepID=A0ABR0A7X2_9CRUS|nr:nuclear pore complex protein Nup98-Nup96-like [Daphnia magna]KAK4021242.1 hypothetical protein OUZ56_003161 [Daphnia magna]